MTINETTKTFPRSLAEAFPADYPEQFCPLEVYKPRKLDVDFITYGCGLFGFGFLFGLLCRG